MKNLCHVSGAPESQLLRNGVNRGRVDHSYAGQRVSGSDCDPTVSNKTNRNATSFEEAQALARRLFRLKWSSFLKVANGGQHSPRARRKGEIRASKRRFLSAACAGEVKKKQVLARQKPRRFGLAPLAVTTKRSAAALDNYCLCATKSRGPSADTTGVLSLTPGVP